MPGSRPHLAHEHELAVAGLVAQPVQLLAHIAGRDEVFFEADTVLRYLDVQVGGQQGDDDIGAADELAAVVGFSNVEPGGGAPGVAVDLGGGGGGVSIGYGDVPTQALTIIQAVVDEGGGGATGTDDENTGGHGG